MKTSALQGKGGSWARGLGARIASDGQSDAAPALEVNECDEERPGHWFGSGASRDFLPKKRSVCHCLAACNDARLCKTMWRPSSASDIRLGAGPPHCLDAPDVSLARRRHPEASKQWHTGSIVLASR